MAALGGRFTEVEARHILARSSSIRFLRGRILLVVAVLLPGIVAISLLIGGGALAAPGPTGQWIARAPMPSPRAEVGVAAIGTKVYVVGGRSDTAGLLTTVSAYDQTTDTWSAAADLPGPARDHLGVVSLGGKIYAVGGLTGWPGPP